MLIRDFLAHFKNVKPNGKDSYMVCCPCHNDRKQSLCISEKNGNILMNCFAGCRAEDILRAAGLEMKDLFNDNNSRGGAPLGETVEYIYSDDLKKIRYYKNGEKRFCWTHFENGGWQRGKGDRDAPLYNQKVLGAEFGEDEFVYVVEGEKDADTLTRLGIKAVSSPNGASSGSLEGKWNDSYNELFSGLDVAVIPDNDDVGRAFADTVANKLLPYAKSVRLLDLACEWEDLPAKGDITDAYTITKEGLGLNRNRMFWMKLDGLTRITPARLPEKKDEAKWEKPAPFNEISLPTFPVEAMPKSLQSFLKAVAESIQVTIDMVCCMMLGIISVCVQDKYVVEIKPDWREQVNLYIISVASPAERKSAVLNTLQKALTDYEARYNEENKAEFIKNKSDFKLLENKRDNLLGVIGKGKSKNRETDELELNEINERIANFEKKRELKLYHDNITTEKIDTVLADEGGCSAIISAEGGIFKMLAGGMYSSNVNIDILLKAYSGDSTRVDRISRESTAIDNPTLTLLFAVQPSLIEGIMSNRDFKGRGLTARFLYSMPDSLVGKRPFFTAPIPEEEKAAYKAFIEDLLRFDNVSDSGERRVIKLSREALEVIAEFYNHVEKELVGNYSDISEWAGKIVGTTARIAALLRRADCEPAFCDGEYLIDGETMSRAVAIGEYFIEHSMAVHSYMGADSLTNDCKYVVERLKERNITLFTRRDLMKECKRFKSAEQCKPVLERLVEFGYIKSADESGNQAQKTGRPAGAKYIVNPYVFEGADDNRKAAS